MLRSWLETAADDAALAWLDDRIAKVESGDESALYLGFGLAPRKVGKLPLELSSLQLDLAREARSGWNPSTWNIGQAARTLLLLAIPSDDPGPYFARLEKLFNAAELQESVALFQALPILPHPELLVDRAVDGLRTNVKFIFSAIAHNNPFPEEYFSEAAWNQMVLKALFIGAELDPMIGIDRRVNPTLAEMLIDYAHERRAAKRPIPVELWRMVGPFADETALEDMTAILADGTELEKQAIALALAASATDEADEILRTQPQLAAQIDQGKITWSGICAAAYAN
ncbi:EboA domain-containing protein [Blastopirellula sp. JC732]|uniref:EboA domain-containing protein n=1 Tax=Blastopirellula sediminis TaxID=2894196 RepID=A0A9X1MTM4_9BACT|nr:EboA domain-containing protein [Blastopirellula sediminis]MCC9605331.1 EboA domain-containing protein [Blastopirellula sediminis]MCC9631369.1 EboA domain-containing protein [Blastopirellula sediminis]